MPPVWSLVHGKPPAQGTCRVAPGLPRPSPPQVQMTVSPGILRISVNDIERRPQSATPAPGTALEEAPVGNTCPGHGPGRPRPGGSGLPCPRGSLWPHPQVSSSKPRMGASSRFSPFGERGELFLSAQLRTALRRAWRKVCRSRASATSPVLAACRAGSVGSVHLPVPGPPPTSSSS